MDTLATTDASVVERLKDLSKQGLYLDALNYGQAHWGEFSTWSQANQLSRLIPILGNLGSDRSGDYLRYKLWRMEPENSDYALSAAYLNLGTKGPMEIWKFADSFLAKSNLTVEQRSDWLLLKCQISSLAKDFLKADEYYSLAIEHTDSLWSKRVKGFTLIDKEEYQQALEYIASLYAETPRESILRQYARYIELANGEHQQQIELLEREAPNYQSIEPWLLLAYEYKDTENWDGMQIALDRIDELKIAEDKNLTEKLSYLNGCLSVGNENYPKAIEYFKNNSSFFCKIIRENLAESLDTKISKSKLLDIPFLKQLSMTCAPASMSALLKYYGKNFEQEDIAKEICYDGTPDYLERNWLDERGIRYREFDLTLEIAVELIDRDLPFALVTKSGFGSHMQVVKGYDLRRGVLFLMDPSSPSTTEALAKEIIEYNQSVGPRCMVLFKDQDQAKLADLAFASEQEYKKSAIFDRELRDHRIEQAEQALNQLKEVAP